MSHVAKIILILFCFILSFPGNADAAIHYISADAAGSNNGSDWNNAWHNFSSVAWTRGDTYFVASGLYNGDVSLSRAENGTIWIYLKKATTGDHGTDAGWSDSYSVGQAEINGTLYVGNSFVDIDGVTGSDDLGYGIKVHYTGCDMFFNGKSVLWLGQGKDSIHIRHMEVEGCGFGTYDSTDGLYHQSLPTNPSYDVQISYCWIHNVSRNGVTIGNHLGTGFTGGNIGFLFENNRLERTGGCLYPDWHGQGVQVYGGTQDYMIFRNNKFIDISGTGYIAYLGGTINDHVRIYNNIFYSTNRSRFDASPGVITFLASGISVNNVQIYNNVFYNIDLKGVTNWVANGTGNELKNNIFASSRFTYGQLGFTSEYNDYYANIGGGSVGVPTGEVGQKNETSDPFADSAGNDFHLRPTALAINNGIDLSAVFSTDRDGNSRPQGYAWDIGAYEFVNGMPDSTPLRVAFTSPLNGSVIYGNVSVAASATDNAAVSFVEFYLDGTLMENDTGTPFQFTWNTNSYSNGSHALMALAVDTSGNTNTSQIYVTVNNSQGNAINETGNTTLSKSVMIKIDREGNIDDTTNVTLKTLNFSDNTTVNEINFTCNSSGDYVFNAVGLPEMANMRILVRGYLTRAVNNVNLSNSAQTIAFPTLLAGDVNGDNSIDILDFFFVTGKWYQSDEVADYNRDGLVNALDFSIAGKNWMKSGD
jgi:hypothetical protein